MRTLRPWFLVATVIAAGTPLSRGARADDPPMVDPNAPPEQPDEAETPAAPLDARIKVAIDKGVGYLRSQQFQDGSWGDLKSPAPTYAGGTDGYRNPLGATAMSLYAMLKCDVPPTDPAIKKGFAWLKKSGIAATHSCYEISAVLLAVTAVADPFKKEKDRRAAGARLRLTGEWREWASSLQSTLVARRSPRGWRYMANSTDPGGKEDVSSSQLAILALAAADRCGVLTETGVYGDAASYMISLQQAEGPEVERAVRPKKRPEAAKAPAEPDGYVKPKPPVNAPPPKDRARGFVYSVHPTTKEHDKVVTGARTACGVGALALSRWALDGPEARAIKKGSRPTPQAIDQAIYDGLAWLSENWSPWHNPGSTSGRNIYYLYCVERAMDLTGADRIGGHSWYLEMVEELLPQQDEKKGFWDTKDQQIGPRNPVIDTSLALLFLRRAAKGGVPVPITTSGDDAPPVDNR